MSQHRLELNNPETDDGLFASSSPVYVSPSSPVSPPTSPSAFSFDRARQEREWRKSLAMLEKDIETLQSTLAIKSREVAELKRKLGVSKMDEFREGVRHGYQSFKESDAVVKTNAAFRSVGDFASKKLSDIRNSNAFKSVEDKVGGAYSNVRKRISSTKSDGNDDDESSKDGASAPPMEEDDKVFGEKVPL